MRDKNPQQKLLSPLVVCKNKLKTIAISHKRMMMMMMMMMVMMVMMMVMMMMMMMMIIMMMLLLMIMTTLLLWRDVRHLSPARTSRTRDLESMLPVAAADAFARGADASESVDAT